MGGGEGGSGGEGDRGRGSGGGMGLILTMLETGPYCTQPATINKNIVEFCS